MKKRERFELIDRRADEIAACSFAKELKLGVFRIAVEFPKELAGRSERV